MARLYILSHIFLKIFFNVVAKLISLGSHNPFVFWSIYDLRTLKLRNTKAH